MADLPKFIRQHFWENNWSKKCDLSKFPMPKLQEIAESFRNLDIKSKSAVIFTFANSSTPMDEEVNNFVLTVCIEVKIIFKFILFIYFNCPHGAFWLYNLVIWHFISHVTLIILEFLFDINFLPLFLGVQNCRKNYKYGNSR